MKVLHITNEFTKKNFSISSLILYISAYLYSNYNFTFEILTSSLEKDLFAEKNLNIFKFKNWIDFFFKKKDLISNISNFDVIHIHGIWAPIQFISLILCNQRKVNCIVHPHGMLLNEALKSAGIIKFILKRVSLFYLKNTIKKNIRFISITNQETEAIKKFFPKTSVIEISNPIPFEFKNISNDKKKKKMVYFGRIHPHKNVHLLIKAFLQSNLSDDWKLEIYGIRDDEKYYKYLNKLIESSDQIEIKNPVFGDEKQRIMREAWLNILVSKSEVLSLSILESSLHGLPSLVNSEIETKGLEDSVILTNLSINEVSKKINEISYWSTEERLKRGNYISENVKIKTSIDKISSKYNLLYQEITSDSIKEHEEKLIPSIDTSFLSIVKKNFNFLLISSAYMFNLMFASLLVVTLVILGHYSIAGELGLVISFWITITQIFSSNMRSIVVSEENRSYALMTLVYRFVFSILALTSFYYFSSIFITFENQDLIISISLLIMIQWINEMNLVQEEIKNKIKLFKIFTFVNIFTVIVTGFLLYFSNFEYLTILVSLYIFFVFISFSKYLLQSAKHFMDLNFKFMIKLNLQTIAFLSSFSIIISSFAWRIMIYYIFDKSLAGIFFACFSIGSFPGTLFNSVIGPAFIRQKITIPQKIKNISYILFTIILIVVGFSIYLLYNKTSINYLSIEFIIFTISISLIGSYFMSYAMYLRHKQIQKSIEERMYLFKRDILYGLSITFLIPLLYYFGGTISVSFAFILASIMAMISYSFSFNISEKNKINL